MIAALLHDDQLGEPDPVLDCITIDQPVEPRAFEARGFTVLLATTTN